MKKIYVFISFLLLSFFQNTYSQISLEANEDYGQIYDVLFDATTQNTLYARTVGNHIIKSTDNGASWEILYSDPMDVYCVLRELRLINNGENLSFNVKAENTPYNKIVIIDIADGEVVKEYNVPNSEQTDILIASYDIYDANNDVAVLHTTYTVNFGFTSEVFITTDGGANWNSIYYSPDYRDISINNVAIAPNNPDKIFLMRGVSPGRDFGGLLFSVDAGRTWEEKIPGNTYSAIEFNPRNADDILLGTFYGYDTHRENLYRSTDGGENWSALPITYTSMSNDNINAIKFNPQNTDNIIVLEENEIISTIDNGLTWSNQVYTDIDPEDYYYGLSVDFNPFQSEDIIIGANFYPFRSVDGGSSLNKFANKFVNSTGRIDSYFSNTESHLYYGLRNGFIHKDVLNNTEQGHRMRTLNNTFGSVTFPNADKIVPGRIFNSSRYSMDSVLEVSLDHGESYQTVFTSFLFLNIYALATAPSDVNTVWFSFGEKAFKIDLADIAAPIVEEVQLPTFNLMYGIIIDPLNSSRVTISQGTKVYITNDAGETWEDASEGLEDLREGTDMILGASINPFNSSEYILATTKGVFMSTDKGLSWSQLYDEYVDKVYFSDKTPGQIVAVNHYSDGFLYPQANTRIVYSTDNGENWELISAEALEYLNSSSSTIQFFESSADVYFGTYDTGLVKYSIDLTVLSTQDNSLNTQDLVLYPNPAKNTIAIESASLNIESVSVYTQTGKLVLQATNNLQSLDISMLSSGVHMLKIETNKGTYFKRLLKE